MEVRCCSILAILIGLALTGQFGRVKAERWSRQVSNSEWIPLANPRAVQSQASANSPGSGILPTDASQLPIQSLTLPPALQQQYQQQLLQLQKTQESIQKLLLLQQQLRTQQQLLQSQVLLPSGFTPPEEDKQPPASQLGTLQTVPDLASEVLVPPIPSSDALPPVYAAQNFLHRKPSGSHQTPKQLSNEEFANFQSQGQGALQPEQSNEDLVNYDENEKSPRQESKRVKGSSGHDLVAQRPTLSQGATDEEEEVQLVYVPAETLAQRGQLKRGRGRKQFPQRAQQQQQQYHQQQQQSLHDPENINGQGIANEQDLYARQLLQQLQKEHEEKSQLLKEERLKEIARINDEQKAVERKNRLQQEALLREQELQKQREAEKKRKELERLEEAAKQRELEKIREAREKQRLEELERRRLAELRAKEERRKEEERRREEEARQREAERLAGLERQKQLELQRALKQQRILEQQEENRAKAAVANENQGELHSLPLIRDQQLHRQHLTETTRPTKTKTRSRQRLRANQYQEQQTYRETTTPTPSPNQPPLSVYMGNISLKKPIVKVSDVLKILKDAKTIAVLDTVGNEMPQVFVGPTNLEPPNGYAKFDLPYLSSLDHNRVERRVDKLPFFVAPLSFDPPPGYSKIPFPAPHIGSVVVNNIDNTEPRPNVEEQNPSPTPLIEPNAYLDSLDHKNVAATTPSYDSHTTASYTQESSSTPRYETSYVTSSPATQGGSRFRFRQYYSDNKPPSVVNTYYEDHRPTTRKQKYYEESSRATSPSTTQTPKVETSISYSDIAYSTTPRYDEPVGPQVASPRPQDLAAQLALINHEYTEQRESQRYNDDQYRQSNAPAVSGSSDTFDGEISLGDINDVRTPVGPTQYNLPAELPAISPHLPGLVNSLVDKQEAKIQTVPTTPILTTTTTTTTTTPRPSSTTYRPRGRQRARTGVTRSRTPTTQTTSSTASTRSSSSDRTKRPFNRSRSRFTTTTEEYRESVYEPTKAKVSETTSKYNTHEHRRANTRSQKYRGRDKTNQSETSGQRQNVQAQQATGFDNVSQGNPTGPGTSPAYQHTNPPSAPESTSRQQQHTSAPSSTGSDYTHENYPQTTVATTENYPPLRDVSGNPATTLLSDDYTRNQNYPQNRPQELHYPETYDHQNTGFEQPALEKTPVNGFNYQAHGEETLEQPIHQRSKEYLQYQGKLENSDFDLATTEDPRLRTSDEHRYSSIYEVNVPQAQPEYALTGQAQFHGLESEKLASTVVDSDPNEPPIFVPLAQNKQEDYELRGSSTEAPLTEPTTESTTTSTTPVLIRQRVRGRIGSRVHQDSAVQTRPRGSQDEYVRFSIGNHESSRSGSRHRESSKARPRTRPQSHVSHIQTEGNDYIKIQGPHHQKAAATTTPRTTTTTTTMSSQVADEDVDYGFIRAPNFQPVHPVDDRYTAPVTFRPVHGVQSQTLLSNEEPAVESGLPQSQLLKNRPKYQQAPNRRPSNKATTLPPTASALESITTTERVPVVTTLPDDALIFTVRPKTKPDESRHTRIRGRLRRPGKKRLTSTTTTTRAILETHNELPLDENYPRIPPSLPTGDQQPLYEENYETSQQFPSIRNSANQYYEPTSENYPPQEFILNFGNLPEQVAVREEYDQTQLASNPPRKYSTTHARLTSSEDSQSTPLDIYGAESQWSTKLTSTSFQPSFTSNRVIGERGKNLGWTDERQRNTPEIITAGPDVSSVTFLVSSGIKNGDSSTFEEESTMMGSTTFGIKTTAVDHIDKLNATTSVTNAPTTISRDKGVSDFESTYDTKAWMMDKTDSSTEALTTIDLEKTTKKNVDPTASRKGTRRRRVRVRVRPQVDDFVTAESQHFNSAVNSLIQDQYKYNSVWESKLTTAEPMTTSHKSVLQDFLEGILKDDEASVPVQATSTSTELPEDTWTMSTQITTTNVNIPERTEESTLKEDLITTISSTDEVKNEVETTIAVNPTVKSYDQEAPNSESENNTENIMKSFESLEIKKITNEEKKEASLEEHKKSLKKENPDEKNSSPSVTQPTLLSLFSSPESVETTEKLDMLTKQVKVPKTDEGVKTFSQMIDEMENASKLSKENEASNVDDGNDYPKNHRIQWSEVRHPSELDASEVSPWNYDTKSTNNAKTEAPSIPGTVTKTEGSDSIRTLSDYVKAIFDSMKNSEEETEATVKLDTPPATTPKLIPNKTEDSQENLETHDAIPTTSTMEPIKSSTAVTTTKSQKQNTLEQTTTSSSTGTATSSLKLGSVEFPPTNTASSTTLTTKSDVVDTSTQSAVMGKILRTSTTTKVSHMTEICYRGRCVMTRPKRDEHTR